MKFTIDLPSGVDIKKRLECIKEHGAHYILNLRLELDAFIGSVDYCHPGFRRLSKVIMANPEILGLEPGPDYDDSGIYYTNISGVRKEYRQTTKFKPIVITNDDIFTADANFEYEAYDKYDDRYVSKCVKEHLIIPITVIDDTITDAALKKWAKEQAEKGREKLENRMAKTLNEIKISNPKLFSKVIKRYVK